MDAFYNYFPAFSPALPPCKRQKTLTTVSKYSGWSLVTLATVRQTQNSKCHLPTVPCNPTDKLWKRQPSHAIHTQHHVQDLQGSSKGTVTAPRKKAEFESDCRAMRSLKLLWNQQRPAVKSKQILSSPLQGWDHLTTTFSPSGDSWQELDPARKQIKLEPPRPR